MERVSVYIEHIVFRSEETGYSVLDTIRDGEPLTCVGTFHYVSEGEQMEAEGTYTEHRIYGTQFQVQSYEIKRPEDAVAVEQYLASGAVKGIGKSLAARIVKRYGDDTLRIMEEEPERLAEIKGISEKKAREIALQLEDKRELRQAMLFLQKYGISNALAMKIYTYYGQRMYKIMEENPYQLADEVAGVGFKQADEIAMKAGIRMDSDYRVQCGLLYILTQATMEGHVYLPRERLLSRASELLLVEIDDVDSQLMNMMMEKKIVIKETGAESRIYASQYYYMELNAAKMLLDLNVKTPLSETEYKQVLRRVEKLAELKLDEKQREAVLESVMNGLLIITGGPGTGKTTTINAIIRYFAAEGMDIYLAAPTGRAAKRMTETTGYEAQTIHRLLEVNGMPEDDNAGISFERNEQNPLEADVIIIDEMSMVDIRLFGALLKAITAGTKLILVGDVNQLPSVGPGCVLKDLISSEQIKVVMLTKIFRQAAQSDIVMNAHKINRGEQIALDNKSKDFFFLKRDDANVIISVLLTLIQKKLPPYVDADPYDIQVLAPMRKGLLGVERLNRILQEYLNPEEDSKAEKEYGDRLFREGDKVMQIKNNYQLEWEVRSEYGVLIDSGTGIFNGDMGIIQQISHYSETVTVSFDEGRLVEYSFKQLEELELAYAVTIHKSQGSEYPAVLIPLLTGPRMLLNRNLLYTAVTRARKCVMLVGSDEVFQYMIQNENEQKRFTSLTERILELSM